MSSRGFKTGPRDNQQYGLEEREPEEGVSRNLGVTSSVDDSGQIACDPFFAGSAVKSIGLLYRQVCAVESAELAATRGSCGTEEVKA